MRIMTHEEIAKATIAELEAKRQALLAEMGELIDDGAGWDEELEALQYEINAVAQELLKRDGALQCPTCRKYSQWKHADLRTGQCPECSTHADIPFGGR